MSRRKSRPWLSSALLDFKQEMKSRSTGVKETTEERTITLDDVKGRDRLLLMYNVISFSKTT